MNGKPPDAHWRQRMPITFRKLEPKDGIGISEMSSLATGIVREHYDPIIGKAQNDYMLELFHSVDGIRRQLENGSHYFFVQAAGRNIGFLAFFPKGNRLYLSKLYLLKTERGKGYSRLMVDFVMSKAREASLNAVELNVNKNNDSIRIYERLGFKVIRSEKNDIGSGYFMDDYVYAMKTDEWRRSSSLPEIPIAPRIEIH